MRGAFRLRYYMAFGCWALFAGLPVSAATTTDISFTPATLSYRYQIGDALPASQSLQIKSSGAAFTFTSAVTITKPPGANWLSLSANSGTTPASLKVYVNPTGLAAGVYQATIDVTAAAATNSPKSLAVTLNVANPPAQLSAAPVTLPFTWTTGTALPTAQVVTLSSSGVPLSATIAVSANWMKVLPSAGITLVGLPAAVTVSVDPTNLAPGSYTGKITFSSSTALNKSVVVAVTLDVAAGAPTLAPTTWPAGVGMAAGATTVTLTGTNFFSTSTAAVNGVATGVTSAVLSPTTMLVTIPATSLAAAGDLLITVVTPPPGGGTSTPATFKVYPATPQVQAVGSVASYDTAAISPGEIITIYGLGLATTSAVFTATGTSIPTALPATGQQTTITVDGAAAPLLFISPTQVTCIVPYAVAAKVGQNVDVIVTSNGNASTRFPMKVAAAHPAVFTLDSSSLGQAAVLNYNSTTKDYTINGTAAAATKGSIISIFATGIGATSQSNPGDEATLISIATITPKGQVTVTVDGQAAAVQGAAAPVGSVPGVIQINATIPAAGITSGSAVKLSVQVDGVPSQDGVTIAVK